MKLSPEQPQFNRPNVSATDALSYQLELLFVCVGGDDRLKILIDPEWKGISLPLCIYNIFLVCQQQE